MTTSRHTQPVTVIAEVGSVHDGSFGNAGRLIDVASASGADVVKFQTHISAAETLRDAPMPPYFKGEPRYEYFERTAFSRDQITALKERCEENGVSFLSSPFSIEAVELLEDIGITQYKIASGEVTNLPLLDMIAQTGKDVILSSGMSSWEELDVAVETVLKHNNRLAVLQCTTTYPCPYERVGLNVMLEMKERYGLPIGLSDHTLTAYAALAAVTLGATIIEKHFAFSRHMYGSDAKHSLEPGEFADMVQGIRAIEAMLASPVDKHDVTPYSVMKDTFEKSVVSVVSIPAGTVITREMIGFKKPGTGIPAREYAEVIGRKAARDIAQDRLIRRDDLD
jgi:N,N'-diacetyllegionaminate synthase